MAQTPADICNDALANIGHTKFIADLELDVATPEARTCRLKFPRVRDSLLEAAPWPFAMRRARLAALAGVARTGWAAVFALPADYLALREQIVEGVRFPALDQTYPWAIEANETGDNRLFLSDAAQPEIRYTARILAVSAWPALFCGAVVAALSAELAGPISKKWDLVKLYRLEARQALNEAWEAASRETGYLGPEPQSEFVRVR